MDAVEFLKEKTRMMLSDVKSYNELKNIPTNDGIVKFVCEWSENHPVKTREEDFWKKHPNAKVDCDFYTEFCCETLGYCKKCNHNYDAFFVKVVGMNRYNDYLNGENLKQSSPTLFLRVGFI